MSAVKTLVAHHNKLDVVWLTHPNPDIYKPVEQTMTGIPNVSVYPAATYGKNTFGTLWQGRVISKSMLHKRVLGLVFGWK